MNDPTSDDRNVDDLLPDRTEITIFRSFDKRGIAFGIIQLVGGVWFLYLGILGGSTTLPKELLIAMGSISLYHLSLTILIYRFPEWVEVRGESQSNKGVD